MRSLRVLWATAALLLVAGWCDAAEISVMDMGAVPDAITDNTAAFQKALDEAGKTGSIVNVPAGRYRINGNLTIPQGVTLQGTYRTAPLDMQNLPSGYSGSILLAYAGRGSAEGTPFITLGDASTIAGFVITYPEWRQSVVPPVPYPPCIAARPGSNNCTILDCQILNAYEAIRLYQTHRFLVRNVQGYPIKRGIFVDECYDIGRIENIHFWPFGIPGFDPADPYCKWINLNGVAFEFARTDWQYVTNTFCFGYGVGYKFSEYKAGGCNGNFLGLGADSCENAVVVEQAQAPGLLITNGEFVGRWSSKNAVTFVVGPKVEGKVSLNNCSFWGPIDRCVTVDSPKGQFTAIGCNFLQYDTGSKGSPAVQLNAGSAILQGNTFGDGQEQVQIGSKVKSAIVMGNQCADGLSVDNRIGRSAQILGNTPSAFDLTPEARAAYMVKIGDEGDRPFVRNWNGREAALEWMGKGTKRWSSDRSQLVLPVLPGKSYTVSLDVAVPKFALEPGAGLYLGDKQIIAFKKEGVALLTGTLPPAKGDTVVLDVTCKVWLPKTVFPNNTDERRLGVSVRSITLRMKGAGKSVYVANGGR